jgi:hypothetical protein
LESFRTEEGAVLLSLQLTLAREERGMAGCAPATGRGPAPRAWLDLSAAVARRDRRGPVPVSPAPRLPERGLTVPTVAASAWKPALAPSGPPEGPVPLIDVETGARTIWALRRDLVQSRGRGPNGAVETLTAIRIEPAWGEQPARRDADRAALRAVVDVAPFVLAGGGQVYRLDGAELAVLITSAEAGGAERARVALESAVQRVLSDRAIPPVGVGMRPMAPAEVQRRVFDAPDRSGPETGRIAAAV